MTAELTGGENLMKKKTFGMYPRDEDSFAGEYIAVVKGKIVSHGKDPREVFETAKKINQKPLFTKVPTGGWKEMRILWMK